MKKITIIIIIILALSCKTTENRISFSDSLFGVVFDNSSNPIKDALLTFSSETTTISVKTDIDGKFLVPELDFAEYKVNIKAKNCLESNITMNHYDVKNILIIKLSSYRDLLVDLEEDIKNNNLESGLEVINNILTIDKEDTYFNYLYAIYLFKSGKYAESEAILLTLEKEDLAYVHLLLADIYQYHLTDITKTIYHLKRFLDMEYIEKETIRLKELLNEK